MTDPDGVDEAAHLRLPANPRYVRVARVVAAVLADELGADLDALDDVRLAVGEVCGLALAAGADTIELDFGLGADSLVVRGEGRPAPIGLDPERGLTEQILAGTTARYELSCTPSAVAFVLRFRSVG